MVWQWQRRRSDRRGRSGDGIAPGSPLSDPAFVARLRAVPSPAAWGPRVPGRHRTSWGRTRPVVPSGSG